MELEAKVIDVKSMNNEELEKLMVSCCNELLERRVNDFQRLNKKAYTARLCGDEDRSNKLCYDAGRHAAYNDKLRDFLNFVLAF